MDITTIILATYETVLSVVFGLLTIFLVTKTLNKSLLKSDSDNALVEGNVSIGLLAGALILCNLMLIQPSILPTINSLQAMIAGENGFTLNAFLISFGFFLVFYVITASISIGVLFLTTWLYLKSTVNIDEMEEINNNNIAVSIMLSLVVIGMTLFIKPSLDRFVSAFVNYDIELIDDTYNMDDTELMIPPHIEEID